MSASMMADAMLSIEYTVGVSHVREYGCGRYVGTRVSGHMCIEIRCIGLFAQVGDTWAMVFVMSMALQV